MKLSDIAERIGGELHGDGSIEIVGVAGIKEAREGEITFFANPRYEEYLESTRASAVIMASNGATANHGKALVLNSNPYLAFLKTIEIFSPRDHEKYRGVHPSAVIGANVKMGENITVGPNVVIEDDCAVGDGTRLLAGTYVGFRSTLGEGCLVYPNVTIREDTRIGDRVIIHSGTVVGGDGFGFTKTGQLHMKVPQIGGVLIEDDVEIGSNVTIDRATTGMTKIGRGTKIDNLVQIAHNVVIGEGSIIVAQVGISGSTEIGSGVTLAGQVGVVGHIKVGDGAMIGAQSGITHDIPPGSRFSGYPAREHALTKRIWIALTRLPRMLKDVARLDKRLAALEERSGDAERS
jgi:UDP-3-O-[3-hydroxymyristoyl] glucosamine N-acyltransferase